MRQHHAIPPGFPGKSRDLGLPSRNKHDSACKCILSADTTISRALSLYVGCSYIFAQRVRMLADETTVAGTNVPQHVQGPTERVRREYGSEYRRMPAPTLLYTSTCATSRTI